MDSVRKNEIFYVPDRVRIAMEKCLETDDEAAITTEYDRLFDLYKDLDNQIHVEYRGAITLDAYVSYYFARNFFIPAIGLADLAYGTFFNDSTDSINALDIGSGTGAVVFGLLWLFSHPPLSGIPIRISALDFYNEALSRQMSMIKDAIYSQEKITHHQGDFCNADSCIKKLKGEGPFDLIFIANCLNEIPPESGLDLVAKLPEILTDKGYIIIAEAQRNYAKKQIKNLIINAQNWGLHVYYPCTGDLPP